MIYFYKITDLKSGKVYEQRTDLDQFSSYRDFIGHLEAMNEHWSGLLRYEESREPIESEKKFKSLLTSEYEVV
jgi:hypothetical protein